MHLPTPLFDAWRQADEAANAADCLLYEWLVQARTTGHTQRLRDQATSARALRQRAHALFEDAMREMKWVADSLHHRRLFGDAASLPRQEPPGIPAGPAAGKERIVSTELATEP